MSAHLIAFWNLENLFAPEGFPEREPWLAQRVKNELTGWTEALFKQKIDQLASIIQQMNGGNGPDILGVCEIENQFVLQVLTQTLNSTLSERTYVDVHADATRDRRGIDTAFIYDSRRYEIDRDAIFSHFVMRRTGTRDITQVTFKTQAGNELVALCNHWPSRSGGAFNSRGFRMTAGETLSYWHERIVEEKGENIPIISLGDFNDDPFDEAITIHARATRERGDVERARSPRFYNLSWRYLQQQGVDRKGETKLLHGTLYFDGNGNVFDQILVSKGLLINSSPLQVEEATAKIELFSEMVDPSVSRGPIRFGLPRGDAAENINAEGYSDHFPVSVVLQER
ncbi:MAG: endonuclease/exonuclease/phosphatase family protein [Cyanobacteria bacterium P01_D01_bin.105]